MADESSTGITLNATETSESTETKETKEVDNGTVEIPVKGDEVTETTETTETNENALLAGKFKSAEELEKGYKELEKKLGTDPKTGEMDIAKFMEHVGLEAQDIAVNWQADGKLTDDQYESFKKAGLGKAVVDIFMQGQMALANASKISAETAIDQAYKLAGGKDQFDNLLVWAQNTLTDEQKEALNPRLDNPATMASAIKELMFDHKAAVGSGDTTALLSGDAMPNTAAGFKTVEELVEAMEKVNKTGHMDEATRRRIAMTPDHIMQGMN